MADQKREKFYLVLLKQELEISLAFISNSTFQRRDSVPPFVFDPTVTPFKLMCSRRQREEFDACKMTVSNEEKLDYIKSKIGTFPDFPKKGIIFRDIFSALSDPTACKYLKELLVQQIQEYYPDAEMIVGLESRGFLFNLLIAAELGMGCAPVRKKGKLPGDLISVDYELEYGKDTFEMQANAIKSGQKVIIVDDLLATGGSLKAASELVRKAGGNVIGSLVVLELEDLHGRDKLNCDVHTLIKY